MFSEVNVDVVVTSLTKIFNGASNLMAGSLILNPNAPVDRYEALAQTFHRLVGENDFPYLPRYDAEVLEYNSR